MPTIPIDLSDDQHAALSIIAGARDRPAPKSSATQSMLYHATRTHTCQQWVRSTEGREIAGQEDLRSEW